MWLTMFRLQAVQLNMTHRTCLGIQDHGALSPEMLASSSKAARASPTLWGERDGSRFSMIGQTCTPAAEVSLCCSSVEQAWLSFPLSSLSPQPLHRLRLRCESEASITSPPR
jgi:hypothetical protein